MSDSSVIDLWEVRENAVPSSVGWAGDERVDSGLFAQKGRAMACGGLQPAAIGGSVAPARPSQPARLTGAVLDAKRTAFQVSVGSGGTAPAVDEKAPLMLAFVDPQPDDLATDELAGEAPRPVPTRRRIRTGMRLDAERCRRLNLVAGFTGRSAQAVIVAALQAYLQDIAPCSVAVSGKGAGRTRRRPAYSPARGTQRSLRLHPHLYWRLMIAAQRGKRSMQSILSAALDSHLDIAAPAICAEVFDCLMGWTGEPGESTPRSKSRPAHWRAQSGRPLGRRRLRKQGVNGTTPRLAG